MEFIQENYIWLIVIAVVLVMTIIGYIAEKTDFGRANKKEKIVKEKKEIENINIEPIEVIEEPKKEKKKKEKNKKSKEEPEIAVDNIEEVVTPEVSLDENTVLTDNLDLNLAQPIVSQNFEEPIISEQPVSETISEDLYAPLGEQEFTTDPIAEVYTEPVVAEPILKNVQPVVEEIVIQNPVVDNGFDNNEPIESDEDIWKF